jgi:hypothetical protein
VIIQFRTLKICKSNKLAIHFALVAATYDGFGINIGLEKADHRKCRLATPRVIPAACDAEGHPPQEISHGRIFEMFVEVN